jgi:hypothetical protein
MPTFMQSLASNPGGGIYGANQQQVDPLSLVNQIKNRDLQDFKDKANFMSNLSLQQDRLKRIYDNQDMQNRQGGPNVQVARDSNQMTGYEKGELGIKQQQNNIESQRLAQQGRLGEQAIGVRTAQEQLNQQKSDQIYQQKQNELQAKINDSNARTQAAQDKLQQAGENAAAKLDATKEYQAAVEERHKLEMDMKDSQFRAADANHKAQIKVLQDKLDQQANTSTTTEVNPEGTKRTTTTQRGSGQGSSSNKNTPTVMGTGKNGKQYPVPVDKIDDWNAYHAKPGTELLPPGELDHTNDTDTEVLSGGQ